MNNSDKTQFEDSDPGVIAVRDHVIGHVTTLVRDLRRADADVAANAAIEATQALAVVGFDDRWRAQAALRATLITRSEDLTVFDRLFPRFWDRLMEELKQSTNDEGTSLDDSNQAPPQDDDGPRQEAPGTDSDPDSQKQQVDSTSEHESGVAGAHDLPADESSLSPSNQASAGEAGDGQTTAEKSSSTTSRLGYDEGGMTDNDDQYEASVYSQSGHLELVNVGDVGHPDGLDDAVQELTRTIAELRGRRWERTPTTGRLDTRRALRRSFGTGGTVLEVPRRARRTTDVRCTLLVDVSRSVLETINRGFLVRFLRTVSHEWRNTQIFFFDTNVREVTDQFAAPSADDAIRALQHVEAKWGGGTRIGHAIDTVRRKYPQSIDRKTTVFVISDGLEVGETDHLEEGMAWIARRANTVLWLNPLAASPKYEPTCRGMESSLPYVDGLFAFTGPDDVTEIARQLRLRGPRRRIGHQYDSRNRNT